MKLSCMMLEADCQVWQHPKHSSKGKAALVKTSRWEGVKRIQASWMVGIAPVEIARASHEQFLDPLMRCS